ncbi:hypothetical protein [Candidatus Phytoplasma oryzae]|nr:hypothetical protein PIE28_02230 [Candidatus Phytoplasma oryzae]
MKTSFLKKIVIISVLIGFAIVTDLMSSISFISIRMPLGGKIFKISFIILFFSSVILGLKKGFIVCLFYAFFHAGKFLLNFSSFAKFFNFGLKEIFLSCFLDYLIPDILICLAGMRSRKKENKNKKIDFSIEKLLKLSFFIIFLRILFFLISSYYVYCFKVSGQIDLSFSNIFFLKNLSYQNRLSLFCFLYCFVPEMINCFIINLVIIFFHSQFKSISEKYN